MNDYVDIFELFEEWGSRVICDFVEFWDWVVFLVFIYNIDDYLCNYGFL